GGRRRRWTIRLRPVRTGPRLQPRGSLEGGRRITGGSRRAEAGLSRGPLRSRPGPAAPGPPRRCPPRLAAVPHPGRRPPRAALPQRPPPRRDEGRGVRLQRPAVWIGIKRGRLPAVLFDAKARKERKREREREKDDIARFESLQEASPRLRTSSF